jgi:hypothetical protein
VRGSGGGGGVDLASVAIDALLEVDSSLLVLHHKPIDHPQPPSEHRVEDRMHKLLHAGRKNRGWGRKVRNTYTSCKLTKCKGVYLIARMR